MRPSVTAGGRSAPRLEHGHGGGVLVQLGMPFARGPLPAHDGDDIALGSLARLEGEEQFLLPSKTRAGPRSCRSFLGTWRP